VHRHGAAGVAADEVEDDRAVSCDALPVSSCRITSFEVASAKRFHQYSPSMRLKSRRVVVPDAQLVRFHLLGRFVDRLGCLLEQIGRLVDLPRERPDDEVGLPIAWLNSIVAASFSPCNSARVWWKPQALSFAASRCFRHSTPGP